MPVDIDLALPVGRDGHRAIKPVHDRWTMHRGSRLEAFTVIDVGHHVTALDIEQHGPLTCRVKCAVRLRCGMLPDESPLDWQPYLEAHRDEFKWLIRAPETVESLVILMKARDCRLDVDGVAAPWQRDCEFEMLAGITQVESEREACTTRRLEFVTAEVSIGAL